ncbi:MAG TPA: hypothetical protein VMH22_14060 [bacterium]|nr:hypothetical protein [bacterium]
MTKSRLLALLAIAAAAGLILAGCKEPMGFNPDANIAWHWESSPKVYTLWGYGAGGWGGWGGWGGSSDSVGTVSVWNTPDTLYVTYALAGNWWLDEARLDAENSLKDIPQRRGQPLPEQFAYGGRLLPRVQTRTYAIPKDTGWSVGDTLYIAAYGVAVKLGQGGWGWINQQENCWAGPYFFTGDGGFACCGKQGARYFKYAFQSAHKNVTLPKDTVTMVPHYLDGAPGADCYWRVTLSNVPSGYDVWNGDWRGWCIQLMASMKAESSYRVRLWSSIDPNLPPRLQDTAWCYINYLINHKAQGATAWDIQEAIWALRGQLGWLPQPDWPPLTLQMYNDALAHGKGWYASKGDQIAVILETPVQVQLCIIEVDP